GQLFDDLRRGGVRADDRAERVGAAVAHGPQSEGELVLFPGSKLVSHGRPLRLDDSETAKNRTGSISQQAGEMQRTRAGSFGLAGQVSPAGRWSWSRRPSA